MAILNHLLFSELFFQQIRHETGDLDNLRATLGTIRDTWRYYLPPPEGSTSQGWQPPHPIDKNNVGQLRSHVIEPIFAFLQLAYAPCESDERAFLLYGDWEQQDKTGLCLVLPYSVHIEGRDLETGYIPKGRNHAQQLIQLLRKNDLEWGVLTNGRFWRLYHCTEQSPTDTYLQVDLGQIVIDESIRDYIVFHRFFSQPAFARDGARQLLDIYKEQSDKATEQIEDHLSKHVEEIVRHLCQGLVESCRTSHEDITGRDVRTAIYQNALFLVYRLLFVLYSEARDLLPLDIPAYAAVCLRNLIEQVRHNHTQGLSYDDDYAIWGQLQGLFALIDQGDIVNRVPAYNGGLFDPGRRPFLTNHRIRNDYLQAALLRLAYMPGNNQMYGRIQSLNLIDYRDLSVRHLGSLYEGLLEYNLFVVSDEPRVVRTTNKKTSYVPYSQAGKVNKTETVLQMGEVYFSETEGERKATGSYYTPEDVVDYIVRNTLGETLQARKQQFYEDRDIQRQLQDLADAPHDIPAHAQIQKSLDDQYYQFVLRQILDLKVLDPAMGSGHFLVNATHTISNFIVDLLNETYWENSAIDTDITYWKRRVAERCIFGVDINELAVELAKLCLWMTTTAKAKPLTFVDHHLRRGNSLVGAWLNDVGVYPFVKKESDKVFTLPIEHFRLDLEEVLVVYDEIYAKDQDDVDEVREKARLFDEEILPRLRRYHELLTLHTSIYFESEVDEDTYAQLGRAVKSKDSWHRLITGKLQKYLQETKERQWLHWELDFIEAFGESNQNGKQTGFDIVIGNPPYASYPPSLPIPFVTKNYKTADSGDLYALFIERSLKIAPSIHSSLGYIVPLSVTFSSRLSSLRGMFLTERRHWEIISFDKRPQSIFPKVQQRTSIVCTKPSNDTFEMYSGPLLRWRPEERSSLFTSVKTYACAISILKHGIPKLGSSLQAFTLEKLLSTNSSANGHFLDTKDLKNLTDEEIEARRLYYFGVAYRWLVAAKELPPLTTPSGNPVFLTGFSTLHFKEEETAWSYLGIFNSLITFWFWLVYGDSFHVTQALLGSVPINIDMLTEQSNKRLARLGKELQSEMHKHVFYNTMRGKITANYNLMNCRHITDEIDNLLITELGLGQDFLTDIKIFCANAAGQNERETID